ncbi:MAG: glycoside hydrolase family 2 TIM barrel-domain containing protein [Rikenellaceae bacterium]
MKRFFTLLVALTSLANIALAREVISINDNWRFYFSVENSADYARTISLPHTWDYDQSNLLLTSQPTTANYLRDLYIPSSWAGKRVFIKFNGVQRVADLMVNGRYVGEHRGGATAFTFEITNFLTPDESNRLHVIVNNAYQNDILPTSREENSYGGIYRDVELIVTDKSAVSPLYYGSDGVFVDNKSVSAEQVDGAVRIYMSSSESSTCQLTLSIIDDEEQVVFMKSVAKAKIGDEPVVVPFIVDNPKLWSVEEPNLYKFVVSTSTATSSDRVEITSGFRSIEYSQSGFMKVNDQPVQWRSVSMYHDYPHVGGAAQKVDIERDVDFVSEMGANAIRSVTHPHHSYLYDLCDANGIMVWIDFPLVKAPYLSDVAYIPTARFHDHGRQCVNEIIAQNYNHPSVVMWGVFSLLSTRGDDPIPYIKELNALTKSLDPYRPTVAVSDQDGDINSITDLIMWNQNLGWDRGQFSDIDLWSKMLHKRWSNIRSAVIYGQNGRIDQQSTADKYKSNNVYNANSWKPEGRQRVMHQEYAARITTDSLFWGVCLNSIFDFKSSRNSLSENNSGLVTFDRRQKKDVFYLYKAMWNRSQPTLHIADKRSGVTTSPLHSVMVYASDSIIPQLITVHDTLPMRNVAPAQFVVDSIMLNDGVNRIFVQQGQLIDSTIVILENTTSSRRISPRR